MKKNTFNFLRIIASLIILGLSAFIVFAVLETQENRNIWGIVLTFILQFVLNVFLLSIFVPNSVDEKNINQIGFAFLTTVIFMLATTIFIVVNAYYNELWFQIVSFVTSCLLLLFIYTRIKKVNGSDLSLLRITNYFLIILLLSVTFLLNKYCDNNNIKFFIEYYYLLPLLMIQGLYELLDRRREVNKTS